MQRIGLASACRPRGLPRHNHQAGRQMGSAPSNFAAAAPAAHASRPDGPAAQPHPAVPAPVLHKDACHAAAPIAAAAAAAVDGEPPASAATARAATAVPTSQLPGPCASARRAARTPAACPRRRAWRRRS
eukprot:6208531-Pleurochrysis_carterae.AAC.1